MKPKAIVACAVCILLAIALVPMSADAEDDSARIEEAERVYKDELAKLKEQASEADEPIPAPGSAEVNPAEIEKMECGYREALAQAKETEHVHSEEEETCSSCSNGTRQKTQLVSLEGQPCPAHGPACRGYSAVYYYYYYYCSNSFCHDNYYGPKEFQYAVHD